VTCYDECVSQFVTCCHQCAGMRLCRHYLQHQSSAWQRRVRQEQRGGGCVPMPGQRRLAISRSRVPDHDGFVTTAAGNLLSIGAPRHWFDTEIARSQHTNQHKKGRKFLKKLTIPSGRSTGNLEIASSPGTRKRTCWNHLHLYHFRACIYQQKVLSSSSLSHGHSKQEHDFLLICLNILEKKTF
jgi:hypothetical protein